MELVFYNGDYMRKEEVFISIENRSFNFGDGFFETIKIINSKVVNFSIHFERIKFSLDLLKFQSDYSSILILEKINYLIKQNNILHGSSKVHISRKGDGRYLPRDNNINILISTTHGSSYQENKAISLCIYNNEKKAVGVLSNLKSSNSLIYILASIYANENNFDNALLLNTSMSVIEASNSNVFVVKGNKVYTPPLSDGCVDGIMRNWILNQIEVNEKSFLTDEILDAEEIFLSNTINGLTSVRNINDVSFTKFDIAINLQEKLVNSNLDSLAY